MCRAYHAATHKANSTSTHELQNNLLASVTNFRPTVTVQLVTRSLSALATPQKEHPKKGTLVYIGTMKRMVRFVKLFSLSTSAVGISLQPAIYQNVLSMHWALAMVVGGTASFFIFITPLLLNLVTKRYVTSIYLEPKTGTFTATTYTFFLSEREHSFTPEQVEVPRVPGLFTSIRVNGKVPLFIDPDLFLSREAFIRMMKYDEPLDWEIPEKKPEKQWTFAQNL